MAREAATRDRTALVDLMPLSVGELRDAGQLPDDASTMITTGFYPVLHARSIDPFEWLQAYLVTYAERDARHVGGIQDLGAFQRFLGLVAARTGQLLNMQSSGSDAGASDKTVRAWLSVLETCYLVHVVRPHLASWGKRLVKMPKVYMTDVGLAATLLGIHDARQMPAHPLRGALFETMVVNEFVKRRANAGQRGPLHFWRDNIGTEVDLVLEHGPAIAAVEVKAGITVASDALRNLHLWRKYAQRDGRASAVHLGLVYGGEDRFVREDVDILPWRLL
jgi:hypothetical protein